MIKVLVPATQGAKERGELPTEWIPASPHVNSTYPIWPSECCNLNYGVVIDRGKDGWRRVEYEDRIRISAYGETQVLMDGKQVSSMGNGELLDIAKGVWVFKQVSRTYLVMGEEAQGCSLEVVRDGRRVALARLTRVTGEEADEIREVENRVDAECWGSYSEGTSDFLSPGFH